MASFFKEYKPYAQIGVASLAALLIYLQRNRVRSGYNYAKDKFSQYIGSFANEWIGVDEIGNNQAFGNNVFQSMLKNVGWKSSEQWCMYFAKAVHWKVFKNDRQQINKLLSGSSNGSFNAVKKDTNGIYEAVESGPPKNGDIAIWQRTNAPGTGHAGIVVKVNNKGTMNTIEGNTGGKSISDGDTVARKVRPSVIGQNIPGSTLKLRGFIRKKLFTQQEKKNIGLIIAGAAGISFLLYRALSSK